MIRRKEIDRFCTIHEYTRGWQVGTGLLISIAPGRYRITGEERRDGLHILRLDDAYRVDARQLTAE